MHSTVVIQILCVLIKTCVSPYLCVHVYDYQKIIHTCTKYDTRVLHTCVVQVGVHRYTRSTGTILYNIQI